MRCIAIALVGTSLVAAAGRASAAETTAEGIAFFESKIRPVLVAKCYQCHSAEAQAAGRLKAELLLDTRDGMFKVGESGPALVPGDKEKSLLLDAIGHKGLEMPPHLNRTHSPISIAAPPSLKPWRAPTSAAPTP